MNTVRIERLVNAWNRFWFSPADVTPLAAIRVCSGLILLYVYVSAAVDLQSYLGPHAWVDPAAMKLLRSPWVQSIWFYIGSPNLIGLVYAMFLISIACFTVGLFTRAASVAVWVGHLSFIHRAFLGWSGMDTVLAMVTFYLLFAPSGATFSVDSRWRGKGIQSSWSANTALRLIQIHTCVIYLSAGLSKLQGNRWWDGTAVWMTMSLHEFALFDLTWLGRFGDTFCLVLSSVGVLLTLTLEIGFIFLIWNPRTRRSMLKLALLLHAGIGLFMGMAAFGAAMLTACLSFVEGSEIRRFLSKVGIYRGGGDVGEIDQVPANPSRVIDLHVSSR
jgi:hypothetical protein